MPIAASPIAPSRPAAGAGERAGAPVDVQEHGEQDRGPELDADQRDQARARLAQEHPAAVDGRLRQERERAFLDLGLERARQPEQRREQGHDPEQGGGPGQALGLRRGQHDREQRHDEQREHRHVAEPVAAAQVEQEVLAQDLGGDGAPVHSRPRSRRSSRSNFGSSPPAPWLATSVAVPRARSVSSRRERRAADAASRPFHGSSRRSTAGSPSSARARPARRRKPCESVRARRLEHRAQLEQLGHARQLALVGAAQPRREAQVLGDGELAVERRALAEEAEPRAHRGVGARERIAAEHADAAAGRAG